MTLQETIHRLQRKEVTPTQLVQQAIDRINQNDGAINAVVVKRFQQALLESQQDFQHTLFKGIPILIKSLGQDLKDEPSTAASFLLKDHRATHTSYFVAKLQELGFIILGQTNSPEFGFKNISDSQLYGPVKHPLNLKLSPGGSSGGASAALIAGYVPVVAASDGGGSIRIPASYGGLVGLKPTRGSMPTGPTSYRGWQGASINFFLTKTLEDTQLLFEAMKSNTIQAPFNYVPLNHEQTKPIKIAYSLRSPVQSPVSKAAIDTVIQTVQQLQQLGYETVEVAPNYDGFKLMETYYLVNGVETAAMIQNIEQSRKQPINRSDIELMSWVLYQYGLDIRGSQLVDALNYWDFVSEVMHEFHQDYALYLTPTTAESAPALYEDEHEVELLKQMWQIETAPNKYDIVYRMFEKSLAHTPFTMLANITGQPAISLPLHTHQQSMPIGIQLMAEKGQEQLLFEISHQLLSVNQLSGGKSNDI
ncbi:MAG TPA: amidase [Erysipelothrix sp.]|nr:amidase [Erysipelothrix sp.]